MTISNKKKIEKRLTLVSYRYKDIMLNCKLLEQDIFQLATICARKTIIEDRLVQDFKNLFFESLQNAGINVSMVYKLADFDLDKVWDKVEREELAVIE